MFDLYMKVLAANGDGSWIVPLLVFVIWVVGSIIKAIGEAKQAKKEQPQRESARPKYKPLTDRPELRAEKSRQPQIQQVTSRQPQTRDESRQSQRRRQTQPGESKRRARQSRPKSTKRTGGVSSLKSGMQAALEEAFAVQQDKVEKKPAKRVSTKPVAGQWFEKRSAKPKTKLKPKQGNIHAPKKEKFSELEKAAQPARKLAKDFSGRNIVDSLNDRNNLKNAILYAEILGKPKIFEGL